MAIVSELFSRRVELPDGGHVDCLADEVGEEGEKGDGLGEDEEEEDGD